MKFIDQLPQQVRIGADVGVYGTVAVGWLGLIQPWLTAIATLFAIAWTLMQMYHWLKKKK